MNIKQAKDYIKTSVQIYLKKDDFGEYRIPIVRQRPVFLLGAPGVGKTAIMEQIAQELGIGLVSYSMTHHTRQSALGLPFIKHKEYEGMEYDVSEYTMSEIIASVYDVMKESGIKEGILFLDEINCVSETLAPSMLQFLQYKVFGRHKVPEGWVIVTAGNPPENNKSVREFDVVTMDRLKVIEVEADYKTWKEYAVEKGIHNAVINYLELKKDDFYHIETTVSGKSYVTARGWEDLSEVIRLYEEENLHVDETLVGQYLRNDKIVREFCAYYDLYNKYKRDYKVEDILSGQASVIAKERAKKASFDERLSLLGMLLDNLNTSIRENIEDTEYITELLTSLKALKAAVENEQAGSLKEFSQLLRKMTDVKKNNMLNKEAALTLSKSEKRKLQHIIRFLEEMNKIIYEKEAMNAKEAFGVVKLNFDETVERMKQETMKIKEKMHNLFEFVAEVFEDGNEMLILVTELTVNSYSSKFISMFGAVDYQKYAKDLMLTERKNEIVAEIDALDL